MRPLYALSFDLEGDRLPTLTDEARRWLASKYAAWDGELSFDGQRVVIREGHEAIAEERSTPAGRYLTLTLDHPDSRIEARRWHTALTAATDGAFTECSVVVSTRTDGFGVYDPRPEQVQTPNIVRDLLQRHEAKVGLERVAVEPFYVRGSVGVGDLLDVLLHPQRSLPVVLVAQVARTGRPLVDPAHLQRRLLGFARVVEISEEGSFAFSDAVEKLRSCFDGGVRVYWPGFQRDSDPYGQPLYTRAAIVRMEAELIRIEDVLFGRFLQTAVARFEGGRLFRRLRETEESARRDEIHRLQESLARTPESEEWAREMDRVLAENTQLRDARDQLQLGVWDQEEVIERLRRELDRAHANIRDLSVGVPTDEIDEEAPARMYLSAQARSEYDEHPNRWRRFDALLERLLDETVRDQQASRCPGGGYVYPRDNSDERVFFELRGGVVYVCRLFPHHQDSLAGAYNELRNGGFEIVDYPGFKPWSGPVASD